MGVRPIRRENLPASIAADLRRQILTGALAPGAQLPGHRELATIYAVSVGSVREAISMLISARLLETRAGRGTYVVAGPAAAEAPAPGEELGRREAEELIEAREAIELRLVVMAIERASAEQLAGLRRGIERMEIAAASPGEYPNADLEFHLALADAAGNRYLLRALNEIRSLLRRDMELATEAAIRRFGDLAVSVESYRQLVDAIEARDAPAAREILASILSRNRESVLGLYALGPLPEAAGAAG